MKKIIDSELIELSESSVQQNIIAKHFGVSEAAVSKRLKILRQRMERCAVLAKLTPNQGEFVLNMVAGSNQTESAGRSYEVTSRHSAKTIGNRLMKDPDILQAISTLMESQGVSRQYLIGKLKMHIDGPEPTVSLRAVDMGFKLHDSYPAKKNINLNAETKFLAIDLEEYR